MRTLAIRPTISCLTAVSVLAAMAPAAAVSPTPDAQKTSDWPQNEPAHRLPEGYRWILGPVRIGTETIEPTSFNIDRLGEIRVEPLFENGTLQKVQISFEYVQFESVAKDPFMEIRVLDGSGEVIRGQGGWMSMSGTVIVTDRYDHLDDFRSTAEWFGVIVLDYEGRLERARSHKNAPGLENYRVPFLPIVGTAFEFDLPTLDDDRLTHEDLLGKIVVYDAWASWCGICVFEMPALRRAYERFALKGVEFVGIALEVPGDDAMDKARGLIENHRLDWPHLHGFISREHALQWRNVAGIEGIPRIFVVDRAGVVHAEPDMHRLPDTLQRLLDEQPPRAAVIED